MSKRIDRIDYRTRRHARVRRKVAGTAARPRMAIFISNRNMAVQFIDDDAARTLAATSTLGGDGKHNVAAAAELGRRTAEVALAKGIRNVVVDRAGFKYHGRLRAIVEAALKGGLVISDKPIIFAEAEAAEKKAAAAEGKPEAAKPKARQEPGREKKPKRPAGEAHKEET
jgi:large subunit ribosomal protein L18